MARSKKDRKLDRKGEAERKEQEQESREQLYATAVALAEQSQPEEALAHAEKLWSVVHTFPANEALPALNLLGEISLQLGDTDAARGYFEQGASRDPRGDAEGPLGGNAEKFLWLAQLCEDGGQRSVEWFEKGAQVLQREIGELDSGRDVAGLDPETVMLIRAEKKRKLANALCGIVEVYMTDLSWEEDAETRCEGLITQAIAAEDETSPEVLQTLASVRLSQKRTKDAQAALRRSFESWKDLEAEDELVPDFATRISLARLLMEAEMEDDAMDVLDRLVLEDDQSVEAWYLGGWCQHLIAGKRPPEKMDEDSGGGFRLVDGDPETASSLKGSRQWLRTALTLYEKLDYEDERLRDHAAELVRDLDATLGPEGEGADDEWEDDWDGIEEDGVENGVEDEEMQDA